MIRKKINMILAASALVCTAAIASPVNAQELDTESKTRQSIESRAVKTVGTVINCPEGLNLRRGASTGTDILRLLPNGTKVNVLSTSNNWHKVEYKDIIGYVHTDYIKVASSSKDTAMKAKGKVVNTEKTGLNLRTKASTSSSVVITIPEGKTVDITAKSGKWYKVKYANKTGYVHSDYIKVSTTTKPETPKPDTSNETAMKATGKISNTDGTGLNLRTKASTSSSVIVTIPEGKTVDITAKSGKWYKVKYANKTGYAHSDYIKVSTTTKPPTTGNGDVAFSSAGYVGDTEGLGLNLRAKNSATSAILLTIPEGANLTITAKNGSWYKVNYGGKTGYVSAQYIKLGNKPSVKPPTTGNGDVAFSSAGYVGDTEGMGLNLRASNNASSAVLATIPEGASLTITAKNGSWYKVNYGGRTGYVSAQYVKLGNKPVAPPVTNPEATFDKVFNIMKAHIGTPYVWGGSGEYITYDSIASLKRRFPNEAADGWYDYIGSQYYNNGYRAFDCSGLMQWAFAQVGINMGRTTYTQVNAGVGVSIADAKPGDMLIVKDQSHVGMYIGNGQWIESPTPGQYVRISNVNWNNVGYVRRVL